MRWKEVETLPTYIIYTLLEALKRWLDFIYPQLVLLMKTDPYSAWTGLNAVL
jgi:hypothetical protein